LSLETGWSLEVVGFRHVKSCEKAFLEIDKHDAKIALSLSLSLASVGKV
jgi:hypothetical protein